ncbi:zinc ion binding protein [Trifolium pratense]|uniref:Zinc ion binding protein n=1 Tax=Trifolium pratense TaxID=57577 RepID=A0A2K3M206_TRIPR|nr:zinc ion binding protein [Trifolium pratense]
MSGLTSWRKALKIPDTNVLMEDGCAKVDDEDEQDKSYIVSNPGSMLSICDCCWAKDGNLCEHILKVLSICRSRGSVLSSISLLQYRQALNTMLHCPPFDSLIRDHAVSLAVSVQKQLNTLLDKESIQTAVEPNEKRIVIDIHQESSRVVSATQDQALVCERNVVNDILSRNGDGLAVCGTSNITGQGVDHGNTRNGKPFEIAGEESFQADMDVDPSSICVPSSGLYSIDETVDEAS